ncbi:MAG: hypothetical protein J0L92_34935 [Deltaproteobacteria bacterium]|nr:hypothetical protein [Deltaproteobacteria bacterium]
MPNGAQAVAPTTAVLEPAGTPPTTTATVAQVAAVPAAALGPAEWPIAPPGGPEGLRNLHWHTADFDEGLVIAGTTLFLTGYLEQIGMSVFAFTRSSTDWENHRSPNQLNYSYDIVDGSGRVQGRFEDTSCRDAQGGLLLIPVVGALLAGIVTATCTVPYYVVRAGDLVVQSNYALSNTPWGGAIPGAILQIVGGILFLVGITERPRSLRVDVARRGDASPTAWSFVSAAPGADRGGLGLRLEW